MAYKAQIQVIDDDTGEVLATDWSYLPEKKIVEGYIFGRELLKEDDAEAAFWNCLRQFRRIQIDHEAR